ncbi:hypothetical protein MKZ38_009518 [Zalerion maritima]|uniref:BTB domain-containing protein n=1 Tax=Zalerion maritima TaxID=339359 RepID=A0AAD5RT78_9PEZI|nr:hypothetical protein MKZ38_009518 [Zalerion maritima]
MPDTYPNELSSYVAVPHRVRKNPAVFNSRRVHKRGWVDRESQVPADLLLRCGDLELRVHRRVLMRWSVKLEMLLRQNLEGMTVLDLSDHELGPVSTIVVWMYTGLIYFGNSDTLLGALAKTERLALD